MSGRAYRERNRARTRAEQLLSVISSYEDRNLAFQPRADSLPVHHARQRQENVDPVDIEDSYATPSVASSLKAKMNSLGWILPICPTITNYSWSLFIFDIRAAASIAFVLIPQAIAFSSLAGVTPIRALVSAIFPLFVYAIFGASRQLSVGPEALSSFLVGLAVAQEIEEHGGDPNELATLLGLLVGIFAIVLAVIRAGFIDNIMSGYILTGFVLGVANLIMIEQVPGMFGLKVEHSDEKHSTFQTAVKTFSALGKNLNVNAAILGVGCLLFLMMFKLVKHKFGHKHPWVSQVPEILILVLLTTIMSVLMDFEKMKIPTLGLFDNTLPSPALPRISEFNQITRLLPNIVIIAIVGFIESQTVTRSFGLKNGYFPSGDRELFALGSSNVVGSFFGAYVTFGSLPRSRILASSGGRTTLAGAMAATIVLILTTTLGGVLRFLPKPTLAAIVMNAAINLIEYEEIGFLFKMRDPMEIFMFLATWALTIFVSIDDSIVFCLAMSALFILRKTTTIKLGLLGRHVYSVNQNGQSITKSTFADVEEYPEAQLIPGVLALSIHSASLEFYNAARLRRRIDILMELERQSLDDDDVSSGTGSDSILKTAKRSSAFFINSTHDYTRTSLLIMLDFARCGTMDSNAAHVLKKIAKNFGKQNAKIMFAGVNPQIMEILKRSGVVQQVGDGNFFRTMDDAYLSRFGNNQ